MMKYFRFSAIVIVFLLTVFFFTGVSDGKSPAGNEMIIAFLGDLTGPVGFWNAPRIVGIQDAIDYINKTFGGIGGRRVRLEWRDHKSNIALADEGYRYLRSFNALVWHTCGTGEQQLMKPRYEKDRSQVIFTCSTSPGVIYPVGYVFGTAPYYPDQFGAFIDWLVGNWDMKRPPRIAFMTYESGYGRAIITRETLEYAKRKGVEIVDTIYVPFVTENAIGPLQRAKKAGADWIFSQCLWQTVPPYLIANKEHMLGLKFAVTSFSVDQVMISKAGSAAEGLTGISSWYLPDEDTPGVNLVNEVLRKKFRRPEDRGSSYFLGWMNMWQTKLAVEETLKRVKAWDKVTPKEIMLTLEKWKDRDIYGFGKVQYSPTGRGAGKIRIVQVKGGKWTPITAWTESPDLVPKDWKEPCH